MNGSASGRRRVAIVAPLAVAATFAASVPALATETTESVEVFAVQVPVHVTRGGEPVRGLTAESFRLFDDGKPQTIVAVDVYDHTLETTTSEWIPPAARRRLMVLFDLSSADVLSLGRAREAALEVVGDHLAPADLVGVATYSDRNGPKIVLNFTTDRTQAEVAIRSIGGPEPFSPTSDALGVTLVEPELLLSETGAPSALGTTAGSSRDREATEYFRELQRQGGTMDQRSELARVLRLVDGLSSMAQWLAVIDGTKTIVFLSRGFDNDMIGPTQDREKIAQMNRAAESGEIWNVDSRERFGNAGQQSRLDDVTEALRRADCIVYAIDTSSTAADASTTSGGRNRDDGGNDGLTMLASETGGGYTRSANDLGRALERTVQSTGVTYVLTFQPQNVRRDGSFHKLRVKVKDEKGVRVSARSGYYAPGPGGASAPEQRRLSLAGQLLAGHEGGAWGTAALAVPFGSFRGKTLVPVVIEIDGPGLLRGHVGGTLPVEVYAYALDGEGRIHDHVTQTVGVDLVRAEKALRTSGMKFYGTLGLEPGPYTLRVLVANGTTGLSSLSVLPIDVSEPSSGAPELLPPLVPDPRGKWVLARQTARPGAEPPFPFVMAGQPYLPAARPTVGPDGTMPVHVVLRGTSGTVPTWTAEVRTADGDTVREAELTAVERATTGIPGYDGFVTGADVGRLDAGEYVLRVRATGPEGEWTAVSSIRFVVQP